MTGQRARTLARLGVPGMLLAALLFFRRLRVREIVPHQNFKKVRRWPRFVAYLPVRCTVRSYGKGGPKTITGTTLNIGAGGAACLLPATLPLGVSILIHVCQEEPVRGTVVWTDRRVRTLLGAAVPHGVAFEFPVDSILVRQWVSQARSRGHERTPVEFDVEYAVAGRVAPGRCLNLSQGGMFVAAEAPPPPGTEIELRFVLPGGSDPLALCARVVWVSGGEGQPGAVTGMGNQFLNLSPFEVAVIGTSLDRLRTEAFLLSPSSVLPLHR